MLVVSMTGGGYTRRDVLRRAGLATAGIGTISTAASPAAGDLEALDSNPWTGRRVLNIAHRGGAFEAPENTLFAFKRAFALGAHAVEFDIWETADGVPVVHHDETVGRRTDGSGTIGDYTLAELKELDAAYWYVEETGTCQPTDGADHGDDGSCPEDPAYPYRGFATGEREIPDDLGEEYGLDVTPNDFRIPTVEEVLETFPDQYMVLELKEEGPAATVAALLAEYDRSDDVLVASFDQGPLSTFRDEAPDVPTGGSMWETGGFILWSVGFWPTPDLWFEVLPLPDEYHGIDIFADGVVEDAHDANLATHAWTINERDELRDIVDDGADGIYTDRPTALAAILEETGDGYDGEPDDGDDGDDDQGGGGPGFTLPVVGTALGSVALAKRFRDQTE